MRWSLILLASCLPAYAADVAHPAVVELFQSQGCSSCPPANANVMVLADRPDVLTLSWEVTYWDYLGWKDSFADPAFTDRQWEYARGLGHDEVYTPQVVVNGRLDLVGDRLPELERAVVKADRGNGGPSIEVAGGAVRVGPGTGAGDVLLIRFDPRVINVAVGRGENAGRVLPHRNVVRQVRRLGRWNGAAAAFALPAARRDGLASVILVQATPGGPILAAQRAG